MKHQYRFLHCTLTAFLFLVLSVQAGWAQDAVAKKAVAAAVTKPVAKAPGCDRNCLIGMARLYLEALTQRDPKRLPLASNVRFTEDGNEVQPGEGMWKNFIRMTEQQIYTDAENGQVAVFGVYEEEGILRAPAEGLNVGAAQGPGVVPALLSLMIKVEGLQITRVEAITAHNDQGMYRPTLFPAQIKPFDQIIPKASRAPRERMIAIVNTYWDGLITQNSKIVLATSECNRYENGLQTTRMRNDNGCDLTPDNVTWIKAARDRRFLVVDAERGIVICQALLDTPPTDPPSTAHTPKSALLSEMFKVKDGKIQEILAVIAIPKAYGAGSGWGQ